ncbi:hypothetical protein [Embleya sp. NBC_00896]|uniref:hypothetical protein n=1 Tax=Embleya sp. NBC_00896 TaxID=2975961 RepID=UPI002F907848|nr:hypothetical protein OG928_44770 [Embleya sp. NBC_00896]
MIERVAKPRELHPVRIQQLDQCDQLVLKRLEARNGRQDIRRDAVDVRHEIDEPRAENGIGVQPERELRVAQTSTSSRFPVRMHHHFAHSALMGVEHPQFVARRGPVQHRPDGGDLLPVPLRILPP